jgi:hypothetical protein
VITPSLPTFFVASWMILPIALGQHRRNRALDVVEGSSPTGATSVAAGRDRADLGDLRTAPCWRANRRPPEPAPLGSLGRGRLVGFVVA